MPRAILRIWAATLLCCTCFALAGPASVPVRKYDPKRDAARDISDAVAEARRTGRNVLVEVGGDWCSWCHILDRYFQQHTAMAALRDKNYVVVPVNFSEENRNEPVLSRYGPIPEAFPHLYVLDSNGKLLHSQDTAVLEQKRGYNTAKLRAFLVRWSPRVEGRGR